MQNQQIIKISYSSSKPVPKKIAQEKIIRYKWEHYWPHICHI